MTLLSGLFQTVFGPMLMEKVSRVLAPASMEGKGLLQSKTFHGISMLVSAFIADRYGLSEELIGEFGGNLNAIMAAFGSLLATYGRMKAETKIGKV